VSLFAQAQEMKYSEVYDQDTRLLTKLKDGYLITEKIDSGIVLHLFNSELSNPTRLALLNNENIAQYYPIFWKESVLLLLQEKRSKSLICSVYSLKSQKWNTPQNIGLGEIESLNHLVSSDKKNLSILVPIDSSHERYWKCIFIDSLDLKVNTVRIIDEDCKVFLKNNQDLVLSVLSYSWRDKLQTQVISKDSSRMITYDDSLFKKQEIVALSVHPFMQELEIVTRDIRHQSVFKLLRKNFENDSVVMSSFNLSAAEMNSDKISDLDKFYILDKIYQYPSGEIWIMEYRDTLQSIIQYEPFNTQPLTKPVNKVIHGDLLLISLNESHQIQSKAILRKNQEFEVSASTPAGVSILKQKNRIYFLFSDQYSSYLKFILYNYDGTVKYLQSKVNLPDGYRFFFEEFLQTAHSEAILPARKGNKVIFTKIKI
jgi:hypothetical protein